MRLHTFTSWALVALVTPSIVSAFWRLPCKGNIVVQRADPVVNPGQLSTHVHTIFGGNGFGFEMDYKSTQASTCSSCTVKGDFSNYWIPTLYYKAKNGTFISVKQSGGTIYYLQRSDCRDPEFSKGLLAFPNDFECSQATCICDLITIPLSSKPSVMRAWGPTQKKQMDFQTSTVLLASVLKSFFLHVGTVNHLHSRLSINIWHIPPA